MRKSRSSFKLSQKILLGLLAAGMTLGAAGVAEAETDPISWVDKTYTGPYNDIHAYLTDNTDGTSVYNFADISGNTLNITKTSGLGMVQLQSYRTDGTNYVLVANFNGSDISNNTMSIASTTNTSGGIFGGAVFMKGVEAVFNDATIQNNLAKNASKTLTVGGALATSYKGNTDIFLPTNLTFNVTKDASYTGNTISAADGGTTLYDMGGDYATPSGGGFLALDVDANATFNISDGATLTIGESGASDTNADTIISGIRLTDDSKYTEATLTKTGEGTLTINSNLNGYYGDFTFNGGTTNITEPLGITGKYDLQAGTLNLKDVTVENKASKLISNGFEDYVTDNGDGTMTLTGLIKYSNGQTTSYSAAPNTTGTLTTASGTTLTADSLTAQDGGTVDAEGALTVNEAVSATGENSTITGTNATVNGTVTAADKATISLTGTSTLSELTASGASKVTLAGTITADTVSGGTADADGENTSVVQMGNDTTAAKAALDSVDLNGGTLYLDPVWTNGTQTDGTEVTATSLANTKLVVGNNSTMTIGSDDKTLAEQAFTDSGLTWGSDVLSALYVASSTSLSNNSIVVDSSATADSAADYGTFKMGSNALLMVDGNKVSGSQSAAITDVSSTSIDSSAKIYIANATNGTTYNLLSGTSVEDGNGIYAAAGDSASGVTAGSQLLAFVGADGNGATQFSVTTETKDASDVYGDDVIAPNTINAAMNSTTASDFATAASNNSVNTTTSSQVSALNSAAALTELAGVQHGLYAANNLFDNSVTSHLTGLYTDDQDKDLWAHYIHSKENIRGLGLANMGASYDAQFNGVVVGSDFYKNGNLTAGAALTYMDGNFSGNTEAAYTKNDVDYYGLALYGRLEQGPMTYLGDISYLHGSNDLKQNNSGSTITGSTDSDAYSIGVRAERGVDLGMGTLTPFAGLRYAHLGTDAYTDSIGVRHDSDDANVWMLPLGVRYGVDVKSGSWTIRPIAEAGYVWTFGDRDADDKVSLDGASDAFGFDIADAGSWYGRLGVEAARGSMTYGIAYQYQDGSSVQSNTWTAAVRYHF